MIRALVVDDEDLPRLQLKNMLSEQLAIDVVELEMGLRHWSKSNKSGPTSCSLISRCPV
jgi:hypothetical protein